MGRPKAWLDAGGVPALRRVVDTVAGICAPVIVVATVDQDLPPLPPKVVRVDDPAGQRHGGPLVGISAGLAELARRGVPQCYLGACDAVLVEEEHVRFVVGRLGAVPDVDAVVPVDAAGSLQPLASAVRVGPALEAARALLAEDVRRATALVERLNALRLGANELPDAEALRGANTPEEWATLRARLSSASDSA